MVGIGDGCGWNARSNQAMGSYVLAESLMFIDSVMHFISWDIPYLPSNGDNGATIARAMSTSSPLSFL